MATDFDAIVIGSGFGGAVAACRLAQQGQRVLLLERGRRWTAQDFPRHRDDPWLWDQARPQLQNGWLDLRRFRRMWVAAGAGVGGGSLIYANVSVEAPPATFASGWPEPIDHAALAPYVARVGRMLGVQELPDGQLSARYRLLHEAAGRCGWGERVRKLPLAVNFDPDWHEHLPDARDPRHSKRFVNAHGRAQGTCVQCGNCDIGCPVDARNSLDFNYLALAEQRGAEIRPLHLVSGLQPLGDGSGKAGWRVAFDRLAGGRRLPGAQTARRVVLAAGSIGSTELLLECRDRARTLPRLSPRLGHGWASNGDFVTPAWYAERAVAPTDGVTISAAIDLLDGVLHGQSVFVEDGGLPGITHRLLAERPRGFVRWLRRLGAAFGVPLQDQDPLRGLMPWFGQGVDPASGRLYLGRDWYAPWRRRLRLEWQPQAAAAAIEALIAAHLKLSAATGGVACVPPSWRRWQRLVTPHPLGGCNMADSAAVGVVDHSGQVFGYAGLYVMDGAIIPRALGLNPSRTIAALAERNCELLLQRC